MLVCNIVLLSKREVTITYNAILIIDILPMVPQSPSDVYTLTLPALSPLLAAYDTNANYLVIVGKPSLFWLVPHIGVILQLF